MPPIPSSHSSIEFWPFWSVLPSVPASPHKTQRSGWKSIKGLCYCQIIFIILLTTFRFQAGNQSKIWKKGISGFQFSLFQQNTLLAYQPNLFSIWNANQILWTLSSGSFLAAIPSLASALLPLELVLTVPIHRQQLTQNLHAHSRRVIYCLSCSHPR